MTEHEWIEVGGRRWCVGCTTYQSRWPWPVQRANCQRDTPYAQHKDDIAARIRDADAIDWGERR
jgi:hypothetical protein